MGPEVASVIMFFWVGRLTGVDNLARRTLDCRICEKPREFTVTMRHTTAYIVVPLWTVRRTYHVGCPTCSTQFDITKEEAEWLADLAADVSGYEPHTTVRVPPGARQNYWH